MTFESYVSNLKRGSSETANTWRTVLLKWAKDLGYDSPDAIVTDIKSKGAEATNYAIQIIDKSVGLYCEKKLASKTVSAYYHAIVGFLRFEDIELHNDKLKIKIRKPRIFIESTDRAPTTAEIARILDHATGSRVRTAILILASSGIRTDELINLKVSNFDFNSKPTKIRITHITKTAARRITFITEECTKVLKDYLGERINDIESYLFIKPDGGRISKTAVRKQIMRAIEKAGLKKRADSKSRTYEIHIHCFRKFFSTKLANAQMHDAIVRMLMGHMNQNDRSYSRFTEEELAEAYLDAESALTVFTRESKDVREAVERLRIDSDTTKEKLDRENAELRSELEENRYLLGVVVCELTNKGLLEKMESVKVEEGPTPYQGQWRVEEPDILRRARMREESACPRCGTPVGQASYEEERGTKTKPPDTKVLSSMQIREPRHSKIL